MAKFEFTVPLTGAVLRAATTDYLDYHKGRSRQRVAIRWTPGLIAFYVFVFGVLPVWVWVTGYHYTAYYFAFFPAALAVFLGGAWALGKAVRHRILRNAEAQAKRFGDRTVQVPVYVDDEKMVFGAGAGKATIPWAKFREVVERPDYWLLPMYPQDFVVVPTSDVHGGILDFIKGRIAVWGRGG